MFSCKGFALTVSDAQDRYMAPPIPAVSVSHSMAEAALSNIMTALDKNGMQTVTLILNAKQCILVELGSDRNADNPAV